MSYRVSLCKKCAHPGGQHWDGGERYVPSTGCHLCFCDGFEDGGMGQWSDDLTEIYRSARESQLTIRPWPQKVR